MAIPRICSIADCGKPIGRNGANGMCVSHYMRWKRHGDPSAGGTMRSRQTGSCAVKDCGRASTKRGWCALHYDRWLKNGDPLIVCCKTQGGEAEAYFQNVVLAYQGQDCLMWPFTRNDAGYGQSWDGERLRIASRRVCEEVNGPPPSALHEAAHSCGKGHEGCVTPAHLSWKTAVENQADKIAHDTHMRGERHHKVKLTEECVREIRRCKGVQTQKALAARFGVDPSVISHIYRKKIWGWLE